MGNRIVGTSSKDDCIYIFKRNDQGVGKHVHHEKKKSSDSTPEIRKWKKSGNQRREWGSFYRKEYTGTQADGNAYGILAAVGTTAGLCNLHGNGGSVFVL